MQNQIESPIRLLLADDHDVLRAGILALFARQPQFTVVAEAQDGQQALALACELRPDVVILDLALPVLSGLQVIRTLRCVRPKIKIVVLSAYTDPNVIEQTLQAGADGYVSKICCMENLVPAVHLALQGQPSVAVKWQPLATPAGQEPGLVEQSRRIASLSQREREVVDMVAAGLSSKQIAVQLGLSVYTVRNHRQHALEKLGVHDTATLTRLALSWRGLNGIEPAAGGKQTCTPPDEWDGGQ